MIDFEKKDKTYPLRLMQHECTKCGLDFVVSFGTRSLLSNGDFFGFTTTPTWNNAVETAEVLKQAKEHYRQEISSVVKEGLRYILRSVELTHTSFLKTLASANLCNGLAVYTVNEIGVFGYFFTARHDDKKASHLFVNKLSLFQSIVDKIDKHLVRNKYWEGVSTTYFNLLTFNDYEKRLIFNDPHMKYCQAGKVICGDQIVDFTSRQMQILEALKAHDANKDISAQLNISVRTVEWHLEEIKKKVGVSGREELRDIFEMVNKEF